MPIDGDDLRAHRAALRHDLLERRALQVLHRDEVVAVLLPGVVDHDDVRVRERRGGARLALEERDRRRVTAQVVGQALQRDDAAQPRVARPVHHAHRAAAELLEDLVAARARAGAAGAAPRAAARRRLRAVLRAQRRDARGGVLEGGVARLDRLPDGERIRAAAELLEQTRQHRAQRQRRLLPAFELDELLELLERGRELVALRRAARPAADTPCGSSSRSGRPARRRGSRGSSAAAFARQLAGLERVAVLLVQREQVLVVGRLLAQSIALARSRPSARRRARPRPRSPAAR